MLLNDSTSIIDTQVELTVYRQIDGSIKCIVHRMYCNFSRYQV